MVPLNLPNLLTLLRILAVPVVVVALLDGTPHGDTLAAIAKFGVTGSIGYISTGGGAFLEFLEGKTLPAVEALEQRSVD